MTLCWCVGCNIPQHTHIDTTAEGKHHTHMRRDLVFALLVAVAAYLLGILLPSPPPPSDPAVATLDVRFHRHIVASEDLALSSKGHFFRDRDMTFWSLFADNFGATQAHPTCSTRCRCLTFCRAPWSLGRRCCGSHRPLASCEYSASQRRHVLPRLPALPFASSATVEEKNIKHDDDALFAYVTGNKHL